MIGKTVSHYKIISKLGEGGMGVVYKAEDARLGRHVALKFLPASLGTQHAAKKRFINEARAASSLEHPNICAVYDIGETDDGQMFIAMPHYDGETLQEKITRGPLEIGEAIDVVRQLASGLAKAHEQGIVHRDIKPGNIFITQDGHVKILDFGLAKLATETRLTKIGMTLGTIAYMSPEQASGGDVDARSDIFSLGAVFYEMLTGTPPFKGDHEAAIIYGILHIDPAPLEERRSDVPERLHGVLARALAKNVNDRYQTVDELLGDLGGKDGIPSYRRRKRAARYVIPAVVILAAMVFTVFLKSLRSESPPGQNPVTLAVLPFENLGAPEDEYFADGITEEITSRLAVIRGMRVISRTSAKQYKDTDKSLRQIGEELGVDYVLEGTIRWDKSGDVERVRITPQLISVKDDFHLWADNYQSEISELFSVQAGIAIRIVEALNVTLLASERETIDSRPTKNMDAYHAYLRGREIAGLRSCKDLELGIQMYQRAIDLDPGFALSYVEMSLAHTSMYHFFCDRTEERLSRAKAAADKALELEPGLPQAHYAMAYYYHSGYNDFERALEELAIAEKGMPNSSEIPEMTAYIRRRQGEFKTAIDQFERAFELSPRKMWLPLEIAVTYKTLREYEKSNRYCDLAISIAPDRSFLYELKANNYYNGLGDTKRARAVIENMPGDERDTQRRMLPILYRERDYDAVLDLVLSDPEPGVSNWQWAGKVYSAMGKPELAYASYDSMRSILERDLVKTPDNCYMHGSLGIAYAGIGRKEDAIREGKRAVELLPVSKDALSGPSLVWTLAVIYTMVGEYDAAIDEYEYLLSIPSGVSVNGLRLDPDVDRLRDHPRFQALLEKYSID
ncbi:MAG: protein kinase [bacterium]